MHILYSKHTETLQTDGVDFLNPGAAFADRRKISQTTRQTQTAQVTEIQSGGNLNSRSGGNTLIEAGKLNAGGNINLNAGYDANGNLLNPDACPEPCRRATLTFAAVKDSDYLNTEDKHSSLSWQSQSGSGHNTETIRLANIKAGKGINVNATGGVMVDIPEVPKPVAEAAPQVDENGKPLPPPPPLTPEELAARHKADLNKQLDTLATQPGQEWIGQLARKVKEKPDQFKFREVAAAAEHWNYSQEGLTPEAAAVIAIAVTYGTAGVAGSAAGSMTGAAAGTTTVASAALAAGMTTLASQATISLINNKGHVGKTLEELGRKESVKQVVAAMLTAGVAGSYGRTFNLQRLGAQTLTGCVTGNMTGRGCESGATQGLVMGGLEWIGDGMRQDQIANSKLFKGICDSSGDNCVSNISGQSAGVNGDGFKVGGGRINIEDVCKAAPDLCKDDFGNPITYVNSKYYDLSGTGQIMLPSNLNLADKITPLTLDNLITALPKSPLGGLQGGSGQLGLFGMTFNYEPGSFVDHVVESFAGPHDWLNSTHYYGVDGNISYASGLWGSEYWNSLDVLLAAPMGMSTLCTQVPGLCSNIQNAVNNASNMPLHPSAAIRPPVVQNSSTKLIQEPRP